MGEVTVSCRFNPPLIMMASRKEAAHCIEASVVHVASSAMSVGCKPPTVEKICAGISSAEMHAGGKMRTS